MVVLDEGHWDEPREPRDHRLEPPEVIALESLRSTEPTAAPTQTPVWVGEAVTCTTFTCCFGFRLEPGDADLVEARKQHGRAPNSDKPLRFTVRCPRCHLTTDLFVPVATLFPVAAPDDSLEKS